MYGGNYAGGIAGGCDNFVSENVYTVGSVALNSDHGGYLGAVCGYISSSITINTTYWLYYEGVPYAVGYSDSLGIPTSIGSTKKLSLEDFYSLTGTLNAGREESVWTGDGDTLPTIIL